MRHKKGKGGLVGVKIDMQKTFDQVEWSVIFALLDWLGFSYNVANLIK